MGWCDPRYTCAPQLWLAENTELDNAIYTCETNKFRMRLRNICPNFCDEAILKIAIPIRNHLHCRGGAIRVVYGVGTG